MSGKMSELRRFPSQTQVRVLDVGMVSSSHLLVVQLFAHCQMSSPVHFTAFLKIFGLSLVVHIDLLHPGPESALGGHVDLIRLKLIAQPQESFSMCGSVEVPSIFESEAHHLYIAVSLKKLSDAAFSSIDFPDQPLAVGKAMFPGMMYFLLKRLLMFSQLVLEHGEGLFQLFNRSACFTR